MLVDEPDEVAVEAFDEDDGTVVLELTVAASDMGKVIGRQGRTINALRTLVKAGSSSDSRRVFVDVMD